MSIYSAKISESAPAIQTPNDIGNDLEQIEKNIMGPDGIEADREEIEASQSGLVGDPIEEMYYAMYESQYNYNQMMRAIGISELKEASIGREFVLEGADVKGFFEGVKKILLKLFEAVTLAFKKVFQVIGSSLSNDKALVNKFRSAIVSGSTTDWKTDGYIYADSIVFEAESHANKLVEDAKNEIELVKNDKEVSHKFTEGKELYCRELIKDISGIDTDDISEMAEKLIITLRGGDKKIELDKSNVSANDVIAVLSGDKEHKDVKKGYDSIKKTYEEALKAIKKLQDSVEKDKDFLKGSASSANAICEFCTFAIQFEQKAQNMAYQVYSKAAREKRSQARRLALMFIRKASNKSEKVKVVNTDEVILNSGTVFDRVKLI